MTKTKQKDNPKFSFLFGGNYFNYYQYKVTTEQASKLRFLFYFNFFTLLNNNVTRTSLLYSLKKERLEKSVIIILNIIKIKNFCYYFNNIIHFQF